MKENSTNKHEVDKAFEQVFENFEVTPSPGVWEGVQQTTATNSGAGLGTSPPASWLQVIQSIPYLSNILIFGLITGITLVGVYQYQNIGKASAAKDFMQQILVDIPANKEELKKEIKKVVKKTQSDNHKDHRGETQSIQRGEHKDHGGENHRDHREERVSKSNGRKENKKIEEQQATLMPETETSNQNPTKQSIVSVSSRETNAPTVIKPITESLTQEPTFLTKNLSASRSNTPTINGQTVMSENIQSSSQPVPFLISDDEKLSETGINEVNTLIPSFPSLSTTLTNQVPLNSKGENIESSKDLQQVTTTVTIPLPTSISDVEEQKTEEVEETELETITLKVEPKSQSVEYIPPVETANSSPVNNTEAGAINADVIRQQMIEQNRIKALLVAPIPSLSATDVEDKRSNITSDEEIAPNSLEEKPVKVPSLLELPDTDKKLDKIQKRAAKAMKATASMAPKRPRLPQQFSVEAYLSLASSYRFDVPSSQEPIAPCFFCPFEMIGDSIMFEEQISERPNATWEGGIQLNYTIGAFELGLGVNKGAYSLRSVEPARQITYLGEHNFFGDTITTALQGTHGFWVLPTILLENGVDLEQGETLRLDINRTETVRRLTIPLNIRVNHHFGRLGVFAEGGVGIDIFNSFRYRSFDNVFVKDNIVPLSSSLLPGGFIQNSPTPVASWSYHAGLGVLYHVGRRWKLLGNINFRSTFQPISVGSDYHPYNIGGRVGLAYKFRPWSKK